MCEKFVQKSITPFVDKFLSEFILAYRKAYNTNQVLLRLIEEWESALDNSSFQIFPKLSTASLVT